MKVPADKLLQLTGLAHAEGTSRLGLAGSAAER